MAGFQKLPRELLDMIFPMAGNCYHAEEPPPVDNHKLQLEVARRTPRFCSCQSNPKRSFKSMSHVSRWFLATTDFYWFYDFTFTIPYRTDVEFTSTGPCRTDLKDYWRLITNRVQPNCHMLRLHRALPVAGRPSLGLPAEVVQGFKHVKCLIIQGPLGSVTDPECRYNCQHWKSHYSIAQAEYDDILSLFKHLPKIRHLDVVHMQSSDGEALLNALGDALPKDQLQIYTFGAYESAYHGRQDCYSSRIPFLNQAKSLEKISILGNFQHRLISSVTDYANLTSLRLSWQSITHRLGQSGQVQFINYEFERFYLGPKLHTLILDFTQPRLEPMDAIEPSDIQLIQRLILAAHTLQATLKHIKIVYSPNVRVPSFISISQLPAVPNSTSVQGLPPHIRRDYPWARLRNLATDMANRAPQVSLTWNTPSMSEHAFVTICMGQLLQRHIWWRYNRRVDCWDYDFWKFFRTHLGLPT
ncbi:hypothetical protein BT63DRAFT_261778 [Microthyrium microscopicum]|uniref:Uncharacterized protein n=1 Tax=Microthyrium microscopicum TaxID=703497 RepID=A0A6A6UBC3_9PEZI|nr:hypothetical protein BT63DRAFT_261778 [Microthyrium microscopicum]